MGGGGNLGQGVGALKILFHPFTVSFNKGDGNCYTIDDPYARVCVPYKVKNMILKVFTLISVVNETRFLV